jgi:putative holliday junction resolvase
VRYLGLDVGDRRIGLALSDEGAILASGLPTFQRIGPRQDPRAIAELVRTHEVGEVVVGLPRRLDGGIGPQAEKVLEFVRQLQAVLKVPIVQWDERFTTTVAEQAFAEAGASRKTRKENVDKVAAILILQNYLDYRKLAAPQRDGPA